MFDPFAMCRVLNDEGVEYVVLGGFAAILRGSPITTRDLDVIPARNADNLERLATALQRLGAKIRAGAAAVETRIDAAFIANVPHMLHLVTDSGDLDLVFGPAGALADHEAWMERSHRARLREGLVVAVADLGDIIASEVAADRPKDQRALPNLESLRDEIERGS